MHNTGNPVHVGITIKKQAMRTICSKDDFKKRKQTKKNVCVIVDYKRDKKTTSPGLQIVTTGHIHGRGHSTKVMTSEKTLEGQVRKTITLRCRRNPIYFHKVMKEHLFLFIFKKSEEKLVAPGKNCQKL